MKKGPLDIVREQLIKPIPVEHADLSGKTVIVVGANTGIGLHTAIHFARMNPGRIILGCRNEAKGKAAIATIERETGNTKSELWLMDSTNFSSVLEFCDKFDKDGGRLDLLVMNAAIQWHIYDVTPDGWESGLQVNHLSTALMSILLFPHLLRTAKDASTAPRLVIVSSEVHYLVNISKELQDCPNILEKLNDKELCTPFVMQMRYFVTKLLNVFFTRGFNARLPSTTPIIVNAVNPGYCLTNLGRSPTRPIIQKILSWLMDHTVAFTAEEGSREVVYAAVGGAEDENEMRGAFISWGRIEEVSDFVLSAEGAKVQDRIWAETMEILLKISPKVQGIVQEHLVGDSTPSS